MARLKESSNKTSAPLPKPSLPSKNSTTPKSSTLKQPPKPSETVSDSDTEDEHNGANASTSSTSSDSDNSSSNLEDEEQEHFGLPRHFNTMTRPTYQPPPKFSHLNSSSETNPFTASNLQRKQLWLITSPSTIPLTSTTLPKSFTFSSLKDNKPILEHKSRSYHFMETTEGFDEVEQRGLHVLLPTTSSDGQVIYLPLKTQISRYLTLSETIPLPKLPFIPPAEKPPPRPQPEGLKMRYQPFGAGAPLQGMERGLGDIDGIERGLELDKMDVDSLEEEEDRHKKKRKLEHEKRDKKGKEHRKERRKEREGKDKSAKKDKERKKEKIKTQ